MLKAFKKSKIVLNFIRKQNLNAHNMRTIEVPACGAFLLTEKTHDQCNVLFKQGESIECFQDIGELVKKIDYYLNNSDKRVQIAKQSHKKVQDFQLEKMLRMVLK